MNEELLSKLRVILETHYNLDELRILCSELGVSFEGLKGETRQIKSLELIEHLERRHQVPKLVQFIRENRPDIKLPPEIQSPGQGLLVNDQGFPRQITGNPFPGLRPYSEDDAPRFFGRDQDKAALIEKIHTDNARFVAIIGQTGCGKSSLVFAGLLPELKRQDKQWVTISFTPGETRNTGQKPTNPFESLANKLQPELKMWSADNLATMLRHSEKRLTDLCGKFKPKRVLICIDQFEELFTLVEPMYVNQFAKMLWHTVNQAENVRIVITLRMDYYPTCLLVPDLVKLFDLGHTMLLKSPNAGSQLTDIIYGPLEGTGVEYEPGLVDHIIEDVVALDYQLAPLAFTLSKLYELREGAIITLAAYNKLGGLKNSMQGQVTEVFQTLSEKELVTITRLLSKTVAVERQDFGRIYKVRPVKLQETNPGLSKILNALKNAGLIIESNSGDFEVVHEVLFMNDNIPHFSEIIRRKIEDGRLLEQMRSAAKEWNVNGQKLEFLWPQEKVQPVYEILEQQSAATSEVDSNLANPGAVWRRVVSPNSDLTQYEKEFLRPEVERLVEFLEKVDIDHSRRAQLGERLAQLGDPRPGVGVDDNGIPDIVWCEVADGEVNVHAEDGALLDGHAVNGFLIAKYPITNQQMTAFFEAEDGYRNAEWWEGLATIQDKPGQQTPPFANYPAEWVSWYQAVAFCRWLSSKMTNYEIRLPTEWEWQLAATGGDPIRAYPWSDAWNGAYANTKESKLSKTVAVGVYPPASAAPCGALDMCGNVKEWCLNEFETPESTHLSGTNRRAVRGGAWFDEPNKVSNFIRGFDSPSGPIEKNYRVGFRVMGIRKS